MIRSLFFFAAAFLTIFSNTIYSQAGATAVPFLLFGTSPDGNALGESRISIFSQSPILASSNPALLGVQGKLQSVNTELYVEKTQWLPEFGLSDLNLNTFAISVFAPIKNGFSLPVSAGLGISQTTLNLGTFVITDEHGSTISLVGGKEYVRTYSFGIGVDYGVRAGLGFNYKEITSKFGNIFAVQQKDEVKSSAVDYTAFIYAPIYTPLFEREDFFHPTLRYVQPFANVSTAFALSNIGDKIFYRNESEKDPLPRAFSLGYTIEAGLAYNYSGITGNLVSFKFLREAEDLLVTANSSAISEQSFPGDMDIVENLIHGRSKDKVTIRKGYEISFLDVVSFRSGSNKMPFRDFFKTTGYGINITKILFLLNQISEKPLNNPFVDFILQCCDIMYNQADYTSQSSVLYGTTFSGITISLH